MIRRFLERARVDQHPEPAGPALSEMELKAGLLREIDLFAGLSEADLMRISRTLPMTTCPRGGLITSPEDDDERVYIVKRGRVRLYRLTPDGKQLTLDILDKGRIVGRMPSLGQQLAETYAEAIEDALICSFAPSELRELIGRYPAIGMNMIRYLSGRLATSERERELLAYRSVEQRLAARLLDLAERFGVPEARGIGIDARFTQQELADMIGTTRETLAQAISRMRADAVLEMNSQRVVILDSDALRALTGD